MPNDQRRPGDTYLRFLQLAEAIRGLPTMPPLDPLEERILSFIASTRQAGAYLSVREMMARGEMGAPATIHTRLKSMRTKGWIRLGDTEDSRRKQIELTPQAMRHFDRLSKALLKAAQDAH
jgi:DNA-binding MarR family transcriptional regulator